MQLKGLVRFFTIFLIIYSVYQLSFTWFVNGHEKKMEARAARFVKVNYTAAAEKYPANKDSQAVYQETLVSEQGRGRLPFFFNGYRSLWEAKKNYSWMKLRNGSYRDYVPDHYRLGYMFVAYGRETYGQEFWKNVTQDASAFKGLFYPLQKGIKKATGKSYTQFTNEAMDFFKEKLK